MGAVVGKKKREPLLTFFTSGSRSERLFYQPRCSLTHIPENPIVMQRPTVSVAISFWDYLRIGDH